MEILTKGERFELARLQTNARVRRERGAFLVEGVKLLGEAVTSGLGISRLIVTSASARIHADLIAAWAPEAVLQTDGEGMSHLSAVRTPPELIGVVNIPTASFEDVASSELVVCLDGVADPGNLGTIIRTAEWFGASAFILDAHGVDPYNDKTVRAAMGSLFRARIWESDDLARDVKSLRGRGMHIVVTDVAGSSSSLPEGPLCLVMGSESHGVSEAMRKQADALYTIPGNGAAESLNVAVSFGIAMHAIVSRP